jgi:hypothetical protein
VALDRVHLIRRQTRVGQRLPDDPLLRRSVRRGQPVAGAVLAHGGAAHQREHRMPVGPGVREPLQQQQPGALGPGRAVRARAERLAPAVRGEPALPAELHEDRRGGHHAHPAGQRQRALAGSERLRGQVQCDQRRGAGGVHGDRGPAQPEGVGEPPRGHAAGAAADQVALGALRRTLGQPGAVVAVHDPGEHPGVAAAHRGRIDPGPLERLPGGLQQQPLLRVDGQRLARADAEELGIELVRVVQEAAVPDVAGARVVRVRVVEAGGVPAPVGREAGDRVGLRGHQIPQLLGRAHPAGQAAGHANDRDGLVIDAEGGGHRAAGSVCGRGSYPGRRPGQVQLLEQPVRQCGRVREVEDRRGRQPHPGRLGQPVAQLHRAERVEAEVAEGPVRRDPLRPGVPEHRRRLLAHQLEQPPATVRRAQPGQPGGQRLTAAALGPLRLRPPLRPGHQRGVHRGQIVLRRTSPQPRGIQPQRDQRGLLRARPVRQRREGAVEQVEALVAAHRCDALTAEPGPVRLGQRAGPAAGGLPVSPGQRERRAPGAAQLLGQRVKGRVRRGVSGLAGGADGARHRGEEHEGGERMTLGQLGQDPRRVQLRPEHRGQLLRGQAAEHRVVERAGGVDDGAERVRVRDPGEQVGHRGPVRHVAGLDGDLRAQFGQLLGQIGGALGGRSAPAGQQQVPNAVLHHQASGHQRTELAGAAGDQHGVFGVEQGLRVLPGDRLGDEHEPRDEQRPAGPAVDQHLGLTDCRRCGHQRGMVGAVVIRRIDRDERDQARVLRLGRPDEASDRPGSRVHLAAAYPHHQPIPLVPRLIGEPVLDLPQRAGGSRLGRLGGFRRDGQHLRIRSGVAAGGVVVGGRGRDPGELVQAGRVQRVAHRRLQPVRRDHPGGQRLDGQHRESGGVRHVDRHGAVPARREAHAQRRRAGGQALCGGRGAVLVGGGRGGDVDPGPGERKPQLRVLRAVRAVRAARVQQSERDWVQRRVEQRRVHPVARGAPIELLREFDLCEDVRAEPPRADQALEGGPVVVAESGQGPVGVLLGHLGQRRGPGRRPGGAG